MMRATPPIASIVLVLGLSAVALAQVGAWDLEIIRIPRRERLCAAQRGRSGGACDEVGHVSAGAWTVSVVHPRVHGTSMSAPTMHWHLAFEHGGAHFGTRIPIHSEATVCFDDHTERHGGFDSFVLEELSARDLVGAGTPEVVVRWAERAGAPALVTVCSLEGPAPLCSRPVPDGPIARVADGITIGALRLPLP